MSSSSSSSSSSSPSSSETPQNIIGRISQILKKVAATSGDFIVSGSLGNDTSTLISILVKNQTRMRFPLIEEDIPELVSLFEQSTFGRGTETVLDTSFRNSWQLDPKDFTIQNPYWDASIQETLVPLIGKGLGVNAPFRASLYKLLLYREGSFFKPHRDSEKEEGMFGTLVIQLPSKYSGGDLVVKHNSKSKWIDFSSDNNPRHEWTTSYVAFYCDCEHEILPLTSGCRVCLIYNLSLLKPENHIPSVPDLALVSLESQFSCLVEEWKSCSKSKSSILVYPFGHRYSEQNLSFDNLKSGDKAVAAFLTELGGTGNIVVLLGILERTSGDLEYGDGSLWDSNYKMKRFKMLTSRLADTEIFDGTGKQFLPIAYEEIIWNDTFKELTPNNLLRVETGNQGQILKLQYRHAGIAIFPESKLLNICMYGESCRILAEKLFLREFEKLRKTPEDLEVKNNVLSWAKEITEVHKGKELNFDKDDDDDSDDGGEGNAESEVELESSRDDTILQLLVAFFEIGEVKLLSKVLRTYGPKIIINNEALPVLVQICENFGWNTFFPQILSLLTKLYSTTEALQQLGVLVDKGFAKGNNEMLHQFIPAILGSMKKNCDMYDSMGSASKLYFLFELCTIARKISYNIFDYISTKPFSDVVPCLEKLAETDGQAVLDDYWMEMAQHFLKIMEEISTTPVLEEDYKSRKGFKGCGHSFCTDCGDIGAFLLSTEMSKAMTLNKDRWDHIKYYLNWASDIKYEHGSSSDDVLITKEQSSKHKEKLKQQERAREMLVRLKCIMKKTDKVQNSDVEMEVVELI